MKKFFTKVAFIALAVASFGLTSCSNEDTASAVELESIIASLPKAKIVGKTVAVYDPTATAPSTAPQGTKVVLSVSYATLTDNSENKEWYYATANVAADGTFTFDNVPTTKAGIVTVYIDGDEYLKSYATSATTTERRQYTASTTESLTAETTNYITLSYGSGNAY